MNKTGLRDDASLAAIRLEWWPRSNWNAWPPSSEFLGTWLRRHWTEWHDGPIAELEHRDAIREQAIGSAYTGQRLEVTARYEVHLDR